MPHSFLTANDLRTGDIVFWTREGVWSLDAAQATLATTAQELEAFEAVLAQPLHELEVVGPYIVTAQADAPARLDPTFPKKLRERRRLAGPGAGLVPPPAA